MDTALDIAVATAAGPRVVDLARSLSEQLQVSGRPAMLLVDRLPAFTAGRVPCFVYPHALFTEQAVARSSAVLPLLRRSVVACAGPIDGASAHVLRDARATLALRPDAGHALRLAGLEALPWALGWADEPDLEVAGRDLDVVVCERWTPERWRVLAGCARVLDGRRCDLRASYVGGTRAGVQHLPGGDDRRALLRRARVALVIGEGRSLDLLAALEAAACGAVIVTDARIDLAPFVPGVHLVCADAASLPTALDALLQDTARESALRAAAGMLVRDLPMSTPVEQLLAAARDAPVAPRRRALPPAAADLADEPPGGAPGMPAGLGQVLSEQRRQGRRLTQLEGAAGQGSLTTTPGWEDARAELSVVVPLYDYEPYVEAACRSVLAARDVSLELVVVDDASTDGGAARVDALMASRPESAIALFRLPTNAGISRARNCGSAIARAPLLLFLDADDELLPHGPARLRDALAADPGAAFSYGLLSVETPAGPVGLLNAEPWNPDLLRDGNYVNALALVRAEVYAEIGGYRSDGPLELGWEDYDLWLRMADAGLPGAHVRQIVARHRAHDGSRTSTADAMAGELMEYLRDRYPALLGARA
jgi:GT2 family glycosyltransferase